MPLLKREAPFGKSCRMEENGGTLGYGRLRRRTGRETGRMIHISMTCEDRRPQAYFRTPDGHDRKQGAK